MASRRALEHRQGERGISIAELVMVAAIALTLFAMAVPAAQNDDQAGAVARNVISDAVRARSYSRRTWETVTMQIDITAERWRTLKQDGSALLSTGADDNGWHDAPVGVDFRQIEGMPTDLTFLPNGRASESTAVEVHIGGDVWEIRVDALSARITAGPVETQ
ncbi:MAG: pilus assembly FimT family protein [Planctomycetota bacterium]